MPMPAGDCFLQLLMHLLLTDGLVFKRMKDGSIVESELFLLNCLKDEREVRLRYLLQTLDRHRNVVEFDGELLLVLLQGPEKVAHLVQAELDVCFQPFLHVLEALVQMVFLRRLAIEDLSKIDLDFHRPHSLHHFGRESLLGLGVQTFVQAPQMALHLLQVPDQAVFQLSNVCSLVAKGVQHFENCVDFHLSKASKNWREVNLYFHLLNVLDEAGDVVGNLGGVAMLLDGCKDFCKVDVHLVVCNGIQHRREVHLGFLLFRDGLQQNGELLREPCGHVLQTS
mmetsp:Transcript_53140/g.127049  ORF Transcript_53140/g.127049 Transcript_53140/m.127049 type:complete len:282 (+) Transcript_53140:1034-1879(+)